MAYALVQSRSSAMNTVTSPRTLAYTSDTVAGNDLILVFISFNRVATQVSDPVNGNWTQCFTKEYSAGDLVLYVFHFPNAAALVGATNRTVTVTWTGGAEDVTLGLVEASGLTSSPYDVSAAAAITGTAYATGSSPVTAQANNMILAIGANWGTTVAATNFTDTLTKIEEIDTGPDLAILIGHKRVTSAAAQSEAWTWGAGGDHGIAALGVFKESGGAAQDTPELYGRPFGARGADLQASLLAQ